MNVESQIALHFSSGSVADEYRIGFWQEDGEVKFEIASLDEVNREPWPNHEAEMVMAVNRHDLKDQGGWDSLRENLMCVLVTKFGIESTPHGYGVSLPGHALGNDGQAVVAASSH